MGDPMSRSLSKTAGQLTRQAAYFKLQMNSVARPALYLKPLPIVGALRFHSYSYTNGALMHLGSILGGRVNDATYL